MLLVDTEAVVDSRDSKRRPRLKTCEAPLSARTRATMRPNIVGRNRVENAKSGSRRWRAL